MSLWPWIRHGSMNEYVARVAVGGVFVELVGGEEVRSEAVAELRGVDQTGERDVAGGSQ